VQDEWAEQRMLESLADARDLLSSKRYEESITLLLALRKEFPLAKEISKLLATAELERAEQEKQQKLVEARTLLAAQRWEDALALLDSLLAAQPKDSTILKLKALALNEREKQARSERLQREWEDLKDLTGKEEYPAVVSRAEELLLEFPGDGNLLRLLEFAREQQAQREMAVRLSNTLDEVEGHLKANHLPEAIAGAKLGLESFPQNSDLNHLLEQAETRQKKEQTRQAIEQRVRNIKIKINREEFSDAIRMAEDAIATLGPDTDVTQLLSSAQVEYNAREKKREEDRKLESVRTLLESGNLEQATLLLDETIKSQKLDPDDPRVRRLSEDIHFAISVTESKAHPVGPPSPQQSPQREYAFLNGLPVPPDPLLAETTNQQAISAKASASQAWGLSQPVIPLPPPLDAPILIPPAEPLSQPPQRVEPKIEPKLSQPPVVTPTRRAKDKKRSSPPNPVVTAPPVSVRGAGDSSASPLHDLPVAPITQKKRPAQVRVWTSSAALGVALLGLILVASSVVLVHSLSQSMVAYKSPVSPPPPSSATPEPEPVPDEPKVIPPAPQPKGNSDTGLTALLQQEEQLWSRAKAESDGARFTQAQSELRKILALPDGGRRKDDARNFLDQVIPQREREEQLFAEAQLGLRQNDPSGLRHAADLFGQVVKLGGPRQQEAQKLQSAAQTSLEILIATDSARQALSRGDFHSARQFAGQLRQKGSDPTSLLAEINQSEQNNFAQLEISLSTLKQRSDEGALKPLEVLKTQFQTLAESDGPTAKDARRDIDNVNGAIKDLRAILITGEIAASAAAAYEGALGRYRRATDQSALEASRDEFQLIARGDSARAGDAQGLLAEINAKITALIQRAIQAAVEKYSAAFEKRDADALRNIWPYMSSVEYEGFRKSFSMAAAIHMSWSNVKIEVAPDQAMATVTIDVTQDFTPKGSKTPMRQTDHAVFHLIKQQNGTWVIKDRK